MFRNQDGADLCRELLRLRDTACKPAHEALSLLAVVAPIMILVNAGTALWNAGLLLGGL
jgi:hypothetical protein